MYYSNDFYNGILNFGELQVMSTSGVNVALGGAATMSSVYDNGAGENYCGKIVGGASRGNDGDLCAYASTDRGISQWWQVDLRGMRTDLASSNFFIRNDNVFKTRWAYRANSALISFLDSNFKTVATYSLPSNVAELPIPFTRSLTNLSATATACAPQSSQCPAGTFYRSAATLSLDRVCGVCAPGTFSPLATDSSTSATVSGCKAQSATCPAGTSYTAPATTTTDRTCSPCAPGTFAATASNSAFGAPLVAACAPQTSTCPMGSFYAAPCTASADRTCSACSAGTYSPAATTSTFATAVVRACQPQSATCQAGTFFSAQSTATLDRVCTPCPPGSYNPAPTNSQGGSSTANGCIVQSATCAAGTYYASAAAATSDRTCTVCAAGTFSPSASPSTFATPLQTGCMKDNSTCPPVRLSAETGPRAHSLLAIKRKRFISPRLPNLRARLAPHPFFFAGNILLRHVHDDVGPRVHGLSQRHLRVHHDAVCERDHPANKLPRAVVVLQRRDVLFSRVYAYDRPGLLGVPCGLLLVQHHGVDNRCECGGRVPAAISDVSPRHLFLEGFDAVVGPRLYALPCGLLLRGQRAV
jgi:hypothetical protein